MACGAKGGGFFYVFPDGRFVPRWTRWLAITIALLVIPDIFFPDSGGDRSDDAAGPRLFVAAP